MARGRETRPIKPLPFRDDHAISVKTCVRIPLGIQVLEIYFLLECISVLGNFVTLSNNMGWRLEGKIVAHS